MNKNIESYNNNLTDKRIIIYNYINSIRPMELAIAIKSLVGAKRTWQISDSLMFNIDPCSAFGLRLLTFGIYEEQMVDSINKLLKPGDVFIDLGGNEGYFSIIAARRVGVSGRVFCIEPQERLWPTIIKNANANSISNVTLIPIGISDIPGQTTITLYPSLNTGASSIVSSFRTKFYPKQKISLNTLDSLIQNYEIDEVALIKIDIEGYEVNALRSCCRALKNHVIKKLLIEIHPEQLKKLGQTEDDLFKLMLGYGYNYNRYGEIHLFEVNN